MIFLVFLGLTFLIQLFAASWYVLAQSKELPDTFKYKMLCSGIYIADTLLCSAIANNFSNPFYYILLSGMLIAFFGDIVEHKAKNKKNLFLILRCLSCITLSCWVMYIANLKFGLDIFLNKSSIIAMVVSLIVFAFLLFKDKSLINKNIIPVLSSYIFTALSLVTGIAAQNTGIGEMQSLSFILILGSSAIFFSDYYLFGKNAKTKFLLRTNLYFFGLMIFSCSVACI